MVRIAWSEYLHYSEPKAIIEVEFCREAKKHMKQIMNFVLWVEKNTGFDTTGAVTWAIRKESHDYNIHIKLQALTTYHLKKINNKFRLLTTRLYHGQDK